VRFAPMQRAFGILPLPRHPVVKRFHSAVQSPPRMSMLELCGKMQ
jgi:hypothetical protein